MSIGPEQTFEIIPVAALLDRANGMRQAGYRLVQIGATRLPEQVELTYSFDRERNLTNLRLPLPAAEARVPSISSIYWCAFLYENEIHDLFNVQVDGMAVDFHGHLYETAVKFPFGSTKTPEAKPAPAGTIGQASAPVVGQASRLPAARPALPRGNAGETPARAGETPAPLHQPTLAAVHP